MPECSSDGSARREFMLPARPLAGAAIAVLLGSGLALLALPPIAVAAAAARLASTHAVTRKSPSRGDV